MSAFCLLQIGNVRDRARLKLYTDAAPATAVSFGGELAFRGQVSGVLCGQPGHESAVVVRFPDPLSANAWYASEGYQALVADRDAAADVTVTRYDETDFF